MITTLLSGPRLRPLRIAFFLALIALITWLALSPAPPKAMSTGWDKANHLLAFTALLLTARLAWPQRPGWWMAAALLAYGGVIEIAQLYVPSREGEWQDLLADGLGLLLGLLIYTLIRRFERKAS